MKKTLITPALLVIALITAACGTPTQATIPATDEAADLIPIRLSMGYIPDVQFAPFYVGIEKGFFEARGLAVTTEHRQETDSAKLVATDEIQFAVISGEQVLLGRQQDLPLVYVFEWYDRFPVGLAATTEQGITSPADLAGHSVGVPVMEGASYIGLRALLSAGGLTEADIDLQTTGYAQVEALATGQVDAVVIYLANEPAKLEEAGLTIDVLAVSDYANLVSNGLVTNEKTLAENPELVQAMVEGLAEALQYTIDHPEEAFEISKNFVEGLADADNTSAQYQVLVNSIELWRADRIGYTDITAWETMQGLLLDMGLLEGELDLTAAYTNDYVK